MKEAARAFDPVRLAYLRAVLAAEGIETVVFDAQAGSLWPGALPSRLMVADEDVDRAKRLIREAEAEG